MSVTGFYQDIGYYLDLFDEKCDNGDYPSGFASLSYAEQFADTDELSDIYLAKAQGYAEIERIKSSDEFYFKTLKSGRNRQEALFGLFQNMLLIGNEREAMYYSSLLEQCADEIDPEAILGMLEESGMNVSDESDLKLVYDKDVKNIQLAAEAIKNSDFESAVKKLSEVNESSKYYCKAMNDLTVCYTLTRQYDKALVASENALSKNEYDVVSICNMLMLKRLTKKYDDVEKLTERLLSIQTEDPFEIAKIATAMCDLSKHEEARKYLRLCVKNDPYTEMYLILLGISEYNLQNFAAAKKAFKDLSDIDSNDVVAKYYLNYICDAETKFNGGEQISLLEYIPQLPYMEMLKLYKRIENFLENGNAEELSYDEELIDAFIYVLETGDADAVSRVVAFVAESDVRWKDDFFDEMLISTSVNNAIKVRIVEEKVFCGEKNVVMTNGVHYIEKKIYYPPRFDFFAPVIKRAFAIMTSYDIITNDYRNEKYLARAATNISYLYLRNECDLRSPETLAVILAKEARIDDPDENTLCDMLDVKVSTLRKYKQQLYTMKDLGEEEEE